ncbi:MAG: arginine--tRNA ligase [Rickettsiaceae bacterium]|nr:arginine--tRNA ligase [Rickettsiaceae bacterium]
MQYNNIYELLKSFINEASAGKYTINSNVFDKIAIEIPRIKSFGHLSSNAALIIANYCKTNPREVAEYIREKLSQKSIFQNIEIAGPGFINFTLTKNLWHKILEAILDTGTNFGKTNIGKGERVNVEFVSANPTGPMHVGHARPAIYGEAFSSVMENCGFDVVREYYVNDAGNQIGVLLKSCLLRYREVFGYEINIPSGFYPGEYLKYIAGSIKEEFGDKFLDLDENFDMRIEPTPKLLEFRYIVLERILKIIKSDLKDLSIFHDVFSSEKKLHDDKMIEKAIEILTNKGLIYKGLLEAPKGEEDKDWEPKEQLLFKSTEFGDDQDRTLAKSDGSWTYFAGDAAYALSKIERGFSKNIIVLGADHSGYVKRLEALYKALSNGSATCEVKLCQMVNLMDNNEPVKMSKRAGQFTTVSDVVKEVGADVLKFMMLTRKNDIILDFDLHTAKILSKENPVYYVQYARVRALSSLNNAKENFQETYEKFIRSEYDLSLLTLDVEIEIIRDLSLFPRIVEQAAKTGEIHKIPYYLQDIASSFHAFWNMGKENQDYKFLSDNTKLSAARLVLISAIELVIRNGLLILGITPLNKM